MSGVELLLSDARGVFIPRDFATECTGWEISSRDSYKDRKILEAGPDHPEYWDTWDGVLREASYRDPKGYIWRLYQDGDLFAYCEELMSDEEYHDFFGMAREKEDKPSEPDFKDVLEAVAKLDRKLDQILARLNNQNMF